MIYFIQPKDGGPIKIGASVNPYNRAKSMAYLFPYGVEQITEIDGGKIGEAFLHLCFRPLAVSTEWFRADAAIWRLILEIIDHGRPAFIPGENKLSTEEMERIVHERFGGFKNALGELGYASANSIRDVFYSSSTQAYAREARLAFGLALKDGSLPPYIAALHTSQPVAEAA